MSTFYREDVVNFRGTLRHILGSPFTVECIGEGIGNVEEVVSTQIARASFFRSLYGSRFLLVS